MRSVIFYHCLTFAASAACRLLPVPDRSPQQVMSTDHPHTTFREVQPGDIPAITTLLIAAFSPGPIYHYIAPDFPSHYAELWYCMNASLTQTWENRDPNTTLGRVIAVEDTPVSIAVWNIRSNNEEVFRPAGFGSFGEDCIPLPGTNATRGQDLDRQTVEIQEKYFARVYRDEFYLNLLATHPKWDGHGFAARHLAWGKEFSLRRFNSPRPITLLATPVGWPLYDSVGFQSIANVTVQMLDGLGELWFEVMEWKGE